MVETQELKKMTLQALLKELKEAQAELFKVQFEVRTGQGKATHKIKELKRYVARILTIINLDRDHFFGKEEEVKEKEIKQTK